MSPSDSSAQSLYNFSVARAVENVERAKIQPWQHTIDIVDGFRKAWRTSREESLAA